MHDLTSIVFLTPGFLLEKFDNEFTVYHPTLTTSFYLNASSALIWQLCDGTNSVQDIITKLQQLYPESRKQIPAETCALLDQLIDKDIACLRPPS